MLENLARKKFLTPASTPRSGFGAALWSATHRGAFEFSRCSPRTFLSAIKGVAEHSGNGILSPQKVHLKAVRLFFGARLRVDAADVRFRIGIGSSSHERLPNNYVKQRENQRVALFLLLQRGFFRRRQIPSAPPFLVLIGRQEHVAGVPRRTHPRDHFYEVRFGHGRATGRGPVDAAANVKKNRAPRSRHGRIRVVPDLDQPMVGEISRAHLFVGVIVGRILRIDHDVAIIIRRAWIVAPYIPFRDLMVGIIAAWR